MSTPGMQWDVLAALRKFENSRKRDNKETWDALEVFAPVLACWAYGHPNQPRPRNKWSQRPWRCDTCETWWVTQHTSDYSDYDTGGHWEWIRVKAE